MGLKLTESRHKQQPHSEQVVDTRLGPDTDPEPGGGQFDNRGNSLTVTLMTG